MENCRNRRGAHILLFPFPSPIRHHRSPLLFTRISARLIHSLSLQTKINDMNTSSYSREPPSPKRATPQNASVGEKASHPSGNPQLARKTKLPQNLFFVFFFLLILICVYSSYRREIGYARPIYVLF